MEGESSSGRNSPVYVPGQYLARVQGTNLYGESSSGRSSPLGYSHGVSASSYNLNPIPVASVHAMAYPFSAMKTPQRLLIPTSTVLDHTRPHVVRTPRSKLATDFDLDAVSDDEDATYVPAGYKLPPSRKVANYIDDIVNNPEMDQVEEETRKIRRDVEAVLKRLHTPRISGIKDFNSYDYSNVYRIPPPVTAAAHNYATAENYDDEERFSPLRTRPRKPLSEYLYASARDSSPDPLMSRYQSEATRRALYPDPGAHLNGVGSSGFRALPTRSSSFATSRSTTSSNYCPDVDRVKNNIAARARYASTRAAAAAGIRKKNEYLMI